MPRGDGTGRHGTGPLNRKSLGQRADCRNPNRQRNSGTFGLFGRNKAPIQPLDKQNDFFQVSLSRIPALLMGVLTMAIPVVLKLQKQIQDSKNRGNIDWENSKSPTISIEPEKDNPAETSQKDQFLKPNR
jgi:hypothetical protein